VSDHNQEMGKGKGKGLCDRTTRAFLSERQSFLFADHGVVRLCPLSVINRSICPPNQTQFGKFSSD
jgi:hypothetical protein